MPQTTTTTKSDYRNLYCSNGIRKFSFTATLEAIELVDQFLCNGDLFVDVGWQNKNNFQCIKEILEKRVHCIKNYFRLNEKNTLLMTIWKKIHVYV